MKKLFRITTVPISLDKLLGEQLRFMNQYFEVTAVSADAQELKRIAKKYQVKSQHIEMTREITPFKDLAALWKMYKFLRKEKPEIVHTHTPKAGIIGMAAAWLARVPVRLHTVAGLPLLEAEGTKRNVLNFVEKLTYAFATKVYPNSFGLMEIIVNEKFCAPQKLKVIGNGSSNGIDTSYFSPENFSEKDKELLRNQLGIAANDFVFVFVGRLVGDKGINELIHAFTSLAPEFPHLKLLLVGPTEIELDPLLPETLDQIERHGQIISVGFQSDVRPYFSISNALVFPSYREGFPNVVLQASAMELPAIVTDINGCNEIISDQENGLIIPPKNAEALQIAMRSMLREAPQWQLRHAAIREKILATYQQEFVWQALLEEYSANGGEESQ